MATRSMVPFLVAMMLLTGVCNTLLTKYQDMQCVRDCDAKDPKKHEMFEQPVIQTAQMFIGEMGCWLVVFAGYLYRRFRQRNHVAPLFANGGGYAPVNTSADNEDGTGRNAYDDDDDTSTLNARTEGLKTDDRAELRGWRIILLSLPAICDILGTTLMNVGLLFVAASIYQMTRGALVLFVGLFSVIFLRRKLYLFQWLSLLVVVTGVAIVGLAGALWNNKKTRDAVTPPGSGYGDGGANEDATKALSVTVGVMHEALRHVAITTRDVMASAKTATALQTIIGVLLIAGAQIFTATQFVLEEWILEQYALEPLKVVGWEGLFGFIVTVVGMIVLHVLVGSTDSGRYGYFDAVEGWREFSTIPQIGWSSLAIMFSIGGFNYFGLSVTRTVSATARSTIDTCRTLFIWLVSLALAWESFKWLQVLGFAALVYGTFVFNGIVAPPLKALVPEKEGAGDEEESAANFGGLLPEEQGVEHH